ncbi:MAG: EF-Tu/IF-2/RF-3 family GTPase [bacterium]|nr:EF-Tu/IF-2/RF-3 family GTPase [bacterium]
MMQYGEHWEEEVGTVEHYYNGLHVAAIHVEHGRLKVGDRIHIRGHTTDFEETIGNMQVNHTEVREAGRGAHVGIPVHEKVRNHDHVYIVH